jgi:hypothetical protein
MDNQDITYMHALGWILATQFIGFGLAGLCRRFLVKPKAMMWPSTFGSIALYISLHKKEESIGRWTMSRYKFFWISGFCVFVYSWVPNVRKPVSVAPMNIFTLFIFSILQSFSLESLCFAFSSQTLPFG